MKDLVPATTLTLLIGAEGGLTPEERARRGISNTLLRLSIGLEDAGDLIADLEQALG